MPKLLRSLTWFDKRNDEWVGEVRLRGVKLPQLQKLFGVPTSNPMYDCFKVEKKHVPMVQRWTGVPISLDKFDYFIECATVSAPKPAVATR
jgi:hypothetical protein